ncbi:hypothetical protein UFOVP1346_16 [uncultured Caudovirales phage]|uniref:Uncharacterized protein n=1 Tax=uncultured Caudovirales phage TaxID=2100421 RepID=A0A6J5R422_9CAUD|nr:hypothetical protein UFOVP921_56 [uncultured Caudovirales phage]CAB4187555.1 hypothetical protein UFOVP1156_32 [uncultured Caudovirales phage]CAB4199974.1 hypothetical protein UFOVP1346_16 [uncultured Caudovirales phage]
MKGSPFVHGDFRGGLNTKAANYLLEDTQCRDCLNVQSTTTGAIVKRPGITTVASQTPSFTSLYAIESTSSDHFLAATSTTLNKIVGSAITSVSTGETSGQWALVEATTDTTGPSLTPAETSQGPVFLSNGNVSKAWDGTTLVDWTMDVNSTLDVPGAAVPPHTISLVHESRIVIASGSTIYWSEVQVGTGTLPRTWMLENQQLFDPDDGDEITGLGRVGSNLIVFKKHKIFVVYDINTGANRRLTTNIGCVSNRSIKETPFGTLFLADSGVYVTGGNSCDLISDQITPTILALNATSTATAEFHRNHYYLSVGTVTLDYDLLLKSWWKHSFGTIGDFATRFNNSVEELYCTVGGKLGRMFDLGTYTDFGTAYSWLWAGPWLAPGQARTVYPAVRKRMKAIRVDGLGSAKLSVDKDFYDTNTPVSAQNPSGTVSTSLFAISEGTTFGPTQPDPTYFGDFNSNNGSPILTGPTTFCDVSPISQARIWGQGVARSWALTFENATTNTTAATIQNYTIFTQERNQ